MPSLKKNKQPLGLKKFITGLPGRLWHNIRKILKSRTRRFLLKSLWLFFPSILFIGVAYFMFWHLTQGKDLMVITLEDPKGRTTIGEFICFAVALAFWVYVTWYSTRLVARAKHFMEPKEYEEPEMNEKEMKEREEEKQMWESFRIQTPRVLAFTCITVILLAFLQLGNYGYPHFSSSDCYILLAISFIWYFVLYESCTLWLDLKKKKKNDRQLENYLRAVRRITFLVLLLFGIAMMWIKSFGSVIALLVVLQIGLLVLMIVRKELDQVSTRNRTKGLDEITPQSKFWLRAKYIIWYDENRNYVKLFMIMSVIALVFYFASIISMWVAVLIGPFPFILLAFGVLLGFGNIITFVSVLKRTNFHFILFVIAITFGFFFDSHKLKLPAKEKDQPLFSQRQDLKEYFTNWLNDPERQKILNDSTKPKYPVYFVMANGGASRSGYWTAKILGGLEDTSGGEFSKHLFCLSGASGGSVGNATFFSLLRARDDLAAKNISFTEASTSYLRSDFLSFTLSHLLGPDIFRNFLPFIINPIEMDRGRALAMSLEKAPNKNCFLYDSFKVRFSALITQKKDTQYQLPILCINTTRMRDGHPAVFSNISIRSGIFQDKNYFNDRIDILSMLGESRDIKLSTAVVLGASFPYISPAGRIDNPMQVKNKRGRWVTKMYPQYFVDGGYFDNSGAGVVNEMIFALNNLLEKDNSLKKYKNRLEFFVLHILNTDPKKESKKPVNSMTNDLMTPFKTMLGSYGKQTTINDQRLKSYLYSIYNDNHHYKKIDLYDDPQSDFRFSMNWVFSNKQLVKMDEALVCNEVYRKEKRLMAGWKNE